MMPGTSRWNYVINGWFITNNINKMKLLYVGTIWLNIDSINNVNYLNKLTLYLCCNNSKIYSC